jgi:outer membrane immunogenic protein
MSKSSFLSLITALGACLLLVTSAAADDVDPIEIEDVTEKAAPEPAPAPPMPPVAEPAGDEHDWTGAYLGVHVGYFRGEDRSQFTGAVANTFNIAEDAFIGGGLLGYNHAFGRFVVGLEADAGGIASYDVSAVPGRSPGSAIEWNTHIRGRAGFAFDRWLPSVAVGLALAEHEVALVPAVRTPVVESNVLLTGVSVGGGLDFAVTDHVVLRVEYLYDDFGKRTMFPGGPVPPPGGIIFPRHVSNVSSHTARFAASWQF